MTWIYYRLKHKQYKPNMTYQENLVNKNKTKKIQNKFKITDGIRISDDTLISNTFNEFFVSIGPNISRKIPNQKISPLQFMGDPPVN